MAPQSHKSPSPDVTAQSSAGSPPTKRRKLHPGTDDVTRVTPTRRKTACQSCRLRKVKCDAVRPSCGICKASASECHYIDPLPEKLTTVLMQFGPLHSTETDEVTVAQASSEDDEADLQTDHVKHGNAPGSLRRASTNPDRPRQSSKIYIAEPSKDFQTIPAHRTTADAVLSWEIFEGKYPPMALIGELFKPSEDINAGGHSEDDVFTVKGGLIPPNEEQIPLLVDRFLQNVHTKNPVLDAEQLVKQARSVAGNGLGWNAWTCITLLAAALGSIAKPFNAAVNISPSSGVVVGATRWNNGPVTTQKELEQAESYFALACRRLGLLKHSILGSQCHFFAGVYLMYTLRPLLAWQYFQHSSNSYQIYMKTTHGLSADISHMGQLPIQHHDVANGKRRRLEESMYWSCFKSESEFRVELPLPQSEIAQYHHPQMFPSPPSPAGLEKADPRTEVGSVSSMGEDIDIGAMQCLEHTTSYSAEEMDLRQHAKQLCNEEESWYYYLTEIALRRIGNRIINTFFGPTTASWSDIQPMLSIALEFDTQVSAWSAHLPAAMQAWETNYAIRAPTSEPISEGEGSHVSRELSWATDNRLLEMRSWLYQPFLYHFIHHEITPQLCSREQFVLTTQREQGLSVEDSIALYHFISSGIECNLKILDVRSLRHRHHGLWYDLRSLMTASLIMLGVVKGGKESWIPGGVDALWGLSSSLDPHEEAIAGKIGHVLTQFAFWTAESPDLERHREVLEDVTRTVQRQWAERRRGRADIASVLNGSESHPVSQYR